MRASPTIMHRICGDYLLHVSLLCSDDRIVLGCTCLGDVRLVSKLQLSSLRMIIRLLRRCQPPAGQGVVSSLTMIRRDCENAAESGSSFD
jgi:hypothetical protein